MTQPATLTLSDFLLARIAEDEAAAREDRPCQATLALTEQDEDEPDYAECEQRSGHRPHHGTLGGLSWSAYEPGAWSPARVLAECQAKRAIVEGMQPFGPIDDIAAPEILRLLALPYADHPDYRQEWRG